MTGISSHYLIYCYDLDDMISTEGVTVPLTGEKKGAAPSGDFVVP